MNQKLRTEKYSFKINSFFVLSSKFLFIRKADWSLRPDLNRRPAVYDTAALPLSYVGDVSILEKRSNHGK